VSSIAEDMVTFLDTKVLLNNGSISTDLYEKPTDTHQYLLRNSCHPEHCKLSIPYSLTTRLRRICSDNTSFHQQSDKLQQHLTARGFKLSEVAPIIRDVSNKSREDFLFPNPNHQPPNPSRVPLVITYHPLLSTIKSIAKELHSILHNSDRMKKCVPSPPIIAYRRPKNISNYLVRANINHPPPLPLGTFPCKRSRCKTCKAIDSSPIFSNTATNEQHQVKFHATCTSSDLIYLIHCDICNIQYVGETEQLLSSRLNGHRFDISHKDPDKPVAKHFNLPFHSIDNLKIKVIDLLHTNDAVLRKIRESKWITKLNTKTPHGLNLIQDSL
jgi:hypothetical protein